MLKKAIPFVLISGIALAACGNTETVPNNNETPMEDKTRQMTPEVHDEQTGPNMDGLNEGTDTNQNRTNEGIMNDDTNGTNNTTNEDGAIEEGTSNDDIMENDLNRNNNNR